jgi:hypothetical protein
MLQLHSLTHMPAAGLLVGVQIFAGVQSLPIFRLPLLPAAQRKFTYDGAMLDFTLHR